LRYSSGLKSALSATAVSIPVAETLLGMDSNRVEVPGWDEDEATFSLTIRNLPLTMHFLTTNLPSATRSHGDF
jgi:hypothetical protein